MWWRVDFLVARWLVAKWFGGEMTVNPGSTAWVHVVQRPSNSAPKGTLNVHISRNYILDRCVLSVANTRRGR